MSPVDHSPALDPGAFAERLLGRSLWPHQLELVRSPARYRVVVSGRQAGKSRALAVLALHEAATRRNMLVMLVSAGEVASRRLLEECAALATASPLLAGSVLDESKSALSLSNGSRILSVPASQRQIRGWSVDLLVVDEAAFIDGEIWRAAEPAIVARPGSRVVLCSSPWGGVDHWFRQLWHRGMDAPDERVESFHWPSMVSPLVSADLIEQWRSTWPSVQFRTEVLGEWADEAGSYFTPAELSEATADYELVPPEDALVRGGRWVPGPGYQRGLLAVAGVDWGFAQDANAVVMLSPLEDYGLNEGLLGEGRRPLFVPWLEARYRWPWSEFIDRLVEIAGVFDLWVVASELNGPGSYPTDDLTARVGRRRAWVDRGGHMTQVAGVWTDARRKQAAFGKLKALLQRRQLVLPNHPELLKQLRNLQFEQAPAGGLRIAVPESLGHDDLALALAQAVSCVQPERMYMPWGSPRRDPSEVESVATPGGVVVPVPVRGAADVRLFAFLPQGQERSDGW